jgi:hypothetical protein
MNNQEVPQSAELPVENLDLSHASKTTRRDICASVQKLSQVTGARVVGNTLMVTVQMHQLEGVALKNATSTLMHRVHTKANQRLRVPRLVRV